MPKPSPAKSSTGAKVVAEGVSSAEPKIEMTHIPPTGGSRKRASQTRARDTVAAILEAAALILEEEGYQAASTNAIALRAGVSIGSLYQYFGSREDVFRALLYRHESEFHPVLARAGERLMSEDGDPSELVIGLLGELLAVHRLRPDLMEALEVELEPIRPPHKARQEQEMTDGAARLLASRLKGSKTEALSRAWLVVLLTSAVSRKLSHTPPDWVDPALVLDEFAQVVRAILDPQKGGSPMRS